MWYPFQHWLHDVNVQVYCACKMTGLDQTELRAKAEKDSLILECEGIDVWHPVLKEKIQKRKVILKDRSPGIMDKIWMQDRVGIKWAHVVLNNAASVYSAGAWRETGKSRYGKWKPTPSVWIDREAPFIAKNEDDGCYPSVLEAGQAIVEKWGTRWKRIKWRFPIWRKHLIKSFVEKLIEFWR